MLTTVATVDVIDSAELGRRLRVLRLARPWPEWYVTVAAERLGLMLWEYAALERGEELRDALAARPDVAREVMGL